MYEPIDDLRNLFPELADNHPLLGWMEGLGPVEMSFLDCRRLPHLVRTGDVGEAVYVAQQMLVQAPTPVADAVLVTSLVAMADELLEGSHREPTRTRAVVELLMTIAERYGAGSGRGLLALAAAIHTRAGDSTLARSRLREFDSTPIPASLMFIDWYCFHEQHQLLARWVHVQLGTPAIDPSDLPLLDSAGLEITLWRWLLATDDLNGWAEVEDRLLSTAVDDPSMVCTIVAKVLPALRRVLGTSKSVSTRTILFDHLEQLVWLAPQHQRGQLWSQLAKAAAAADDSARSEQFIAAALAEVAAQTSPPPPLSRASLVADLLDARLGFPGEAPPSVDSRAEVVPPEVVDAVRQPSPTLLPSELAEVLSTATAVLVAGAELPEVNGAPGRVEVMRSLVGQLDDESLRASGRAQMLAAIDGGNLDTVARLLRSLVPDLEPRIAAIYQNAPAGTAYDSLAQTALAGVISMCWDPHLLEAFSFRSPIVVRTGWGEVLAAAKSQDLTFTWLAGDPQRGPVALGPQELRAAVAADDTFGRFLSGTVQSSPLLFVGMPATDLAEFFEALPGGPFSSSNAPPPPRYAVCPIDDLWELNRTQMRSLYGVELIGYDPADPEALRGVIDQISYLTRPVGGEARHPSGVPSATKLSRILLTNIGAFEQLELELSPAWNLLLGNNGCGKSTVLRAVALGLCGDHPRAMEAGEALLRVGCDQGVIELHVGASRYVTELRRSGRTVRVTTTSLTPLQQGNWVVLGFPALRGMSQAGPTGLSSLSAPEPRVEDLLPLLLGELDHRLDDIKQWIINVDSRARQTDGERWRQLLDRFFDVLADLTPGLDFTFEAVDSESWEVTVRTDDGVVSIDQLSQGMSSIIAWVGTLLQRMYDIYADSPEPASEGAFVLIDELDAHLHPAWQRLLPSLTRTHFPNVQYLATSHSPLVAASLEPGELFVAQREPREDADGSERQQATIVVADVNPHGLRADQLLTSSLFGLTTSRSPKVMIDTERYGQLLAKDNRTADEQAEMDRLGMMLRAVYSDGETAEARAATAAEDAELERQMDSTVVHEGRLDTLRDLARDLTPPDYGAEA